MRDPDGSAPMADTLAIEAAAVALKRWRSVHTWCELHGRIDDDGEIRPAAEYELRGETALHRCLDVLGLNPAARGRLGLNIARAQSYGDLALAMSAEAEDLFEEPDRVQAPAPTAGDVSTTEETPIAGDVTCSQVIPSAEGTSGLRANGTSGLKEDPADA